MSKLNRRGFLQGASLLAAGSVLAACTSESEAPAEATEEPKAEAPEPESVSIDFWWGWTPDIHVNAINAAVDKFEEKNPHITVRTAQHEWGEKLLTALAAGTPPDLFEQNAPAEWAAKGSVRALDEYIDADRFLDASIKLASWEGKIYGVPALEHFDHLGLCINKRLGEEAGMALPDDMPKTWEEAWEQTVEHSEVDANGNIRRLWFASWGEYWMWWAATFGITAYDEDNKKFGFDDAKWEDVVNWQARYYQYFGPEKVEEFYNTYPGWSAAAGCSMCSEVQAMQLDGYWVPGELAKTAPDLHFVYSWVPMSEDRKGTKVQMVGSHHVMIPNDAKSPEAAWQLAEHLTSNESIDIIFDGCGFLLVTKDFLKDPSSVVDVNKYEGLDFYINSLTEADEITSWPACPIDSFVWDQFAKALNAAIYNEKTAEQALADLQKACTEELESALS